MKTRTILLLMAVATMGLGLTNCTSDGNETNANVDTERSQTTDDCGVVRKYMPGIKIAVVEGEEQNMKLTRSEELSAIASFLNV